MTNSLTITRRQLREAAEPVDWTQRKERARAFVRQELRKGRHWSDLTYTYDRDEKDNETTIEHAAMRVPDTHTLLLDGAIVSDRCGPHAV